jgi:hypothetical protein
MGEISDAEYYQALAEYRDKYLGETTAEWRRFTLETKGYQDKAAKEAEQAAKSVFDEQISGMKTGISERDFYDDWEGGKERIEAFRSVRNELLRGYDEAILDKKEFEKRLREANRDIYSAEMELADNLIKAQEKQLSAFKSAQDKMLIAAKARSEQFLKIKQDELNAQLRELDSELKARKYAADANIKAIKAQADARKKADDNYLKSRDIARLQERERVFRSAVTIEGRNEYQRVTDELDRLRREERQAAAQEQTAARIEAWQADYDAYAEKNKEQQEALKKAFDDLKQSETDKLNDLRSVLEAQYQIAKEQLDALKGLKLADVEAGLAAVSGNLASAINNVQNITNSINNNVIVNNNVKNNQQAGLVARGLELALRSGAALWK